MGPLARLVSDQGTVLGGDMLDPEYPSPPSIVRQEPPQDWSQGPGTGNDYAYDAPNVLSKLMGADLGQYYHCERV